MNWTRVISFIDRFGRSHDVVLMDKRRYALCRDAYGHNWPSIRRHIGRLWLLRLDLSRIGRQGNGV